MRSRAISPDGRRLLRVGLAGSKRPLWIITGWSVLEAGPALAAGWVTAAALDRGFLAGRSAIGVAWLTLLAALLVLRAAAGQAMFPHLAAVIEPLRDHLVRTVVGGTLARATDLATPTDAAAVSRLTRQVDTVRALCAALLRTARPLGVTLVAATVGLLALNPVAAAVTLPPLALALVLYPVSLGPIARCRRLLVLADEQVAAEVGAALNARRDITALGAEEHATAEVAVVAEGAARALTRVSLVDSSRAVIVLLGGYGPLLTLLLAGPGLVGRGAITVGGLVGAATYQASQILPALRLLTGTVGAYWTQLGVTVSRLAEATRPSTRRPAGAAPAGARHDIVVDRVSFAYGPDAAPVLRDLSLTIPPDDHVAIVGASGIGKSTLANILAGLEAPTAGTVRLDGVPIASVDEHTRTRLVALVPQEAYVFPGTVRENLCYLNPPATRQVLEQAVDRLGLAPVVARLGGLDAELVNPAQELSSGERQLVVLTRVYVSPARVVLLDEATCHLDPAAEARAETAFAARPGTLIIIAHRISSARRARRILLLDGQQARYGSHDELLTRSPRYADLVGHWHQPTPLPGPAPVP